jgi:hypothetical protein
VGFFATTDAYVYNSLVVCGECMHVVCIFMCVTMLCGCECGNFVLSA